MKKLSHIGEPLRKKSPVKNTKLFLELPMTHFLAIAVVLRTREFLGNRMIYCKGKNSIAVSDVLDIQSISAPDGFLEFALRPKSLKYDKNY